jgi:hypothetical protein
MSVLMNYRLPDGHRVPHHLLGGIPGLRAAILARSSLRRLRMTQAIFNNSRTFSFRAKLTARTPYLITVLRFILPTSIHWIIDTL